MSFNSQFAYNHIKKLAFPRLQGTPNERKAIKYIVNFFKSEGLEVELQNFQFTGLSADIYSRYVFIAFIIGILMVCFLYGYSSIIACILCVAMLSAMLSMTRWKTSWEMLYNIGKQRYSQNVIARKFGENNSQSEGKVNLIYIAHHDSKSQTFPIALRVIMYSAAGLSLIGLTIVCLLAWILKLTATLRLPIWGLGLTISAILFSLQFNFTGNASPGAYDNASGVAVLLELARSLKMENLNNLNLTFLATGAEEMGMAGAIRYIQQYGQNLNPDKTYFVNLDGVGAEGKIAIVSKYGIPPCSTSKRLNKIVVKCGENAGIEVSEICAPGGVGFDHIPIAKRGFESVTLYTSGYKFAGFDVHSKRDRIEKVKLSGLQKCGDLCYQLALWLNSKRIL